MRKYIHRTQNPLEVYDSRSLGTVVPLTKIQVTNNQIVFHNTEDRALRTALQSQPVN